MRESGEDDDTIEYMKGIMRGKLKEFEDKIKDVETSIDAFAALYLFRNSQEYRPAFIKSSESKRADKKKEITKIDPLLGKIPETHEEEKQCLMLKVKEAKQRMYSIETNLREDEVEEDKINYEDKINEVFDLTKVNKKRIEEVFNTLNLNLTGTKTIVYKDVRTEIEKLQNSLLKRIKDIPRNVIGADEETINSLKSDVTKVLDRYKELSDKVKKNEKSINEHDDEINTVIRACESKINKMDFLTLDKKVKELDVNVEQLRFYVNNLKIPKPVEKTDDDSAKYQELERMLLGLEGKLDRTQETLNQRMNDINKFMDMIKEDVDKTMEEQEKQVVKSMSRCNVCEVRIDALEKKMKESTPARSGGSISIADLEGKEAFKMVRQLEGKVGKLKEDLLKRFQGIEYSKLPEKADKEGFTQLEKKMYDKVKSLEREILKLKNDLQSHSKLQDNIKKEIKKTTRIKEPSLERDEVSLMKKPLMGYKCANCERDLNNLEGTQAEFFNWKKLPRSIKKKSHKINMNLHNIGHGFSKMLQTFSTENLHDKGLFKSVDHEIDPSINEQEDQNAEIVRYPNREYLSDNEFEGNVDENKDL